VGHTVSDYSNVRLGTVGHTLSDYSYIVRVETVVTQCLIIIMSGSVLWVTQCLIIIISGWELCHTGSDYSKICQGRNCGTCSV
jgi:hypothetical protein